MTIATRDDIQLSNARIVWRAAQDIEDGAYVDLAIGFPETVARYPPADVRRPSTRKTAFSISGSPRQRVRNIGT